MPYSGPASAYGAIGRTEQAYFSKVNAEGGIGGRKVVFISYDDSYNPQKTVQQARRLIESDEVLLIFQSLGTPSNTAIQRYMNGVKVPQLFVATGAAKWNDPAHFPWTMGWQPDYQSEARAYAGMILTQNPSAKIAVLFQNDDFGKDYLKGLKEGLGHQAGSMIVAEESYEPSEPSIDSQIGKLKASAADVFVNISTPKFAAQAIKKVAESGWKPTHYLANVSLSIGTTIKPAGIDNAQGIISSAYLKDPTDPQWNDDAGMKEFFSFLDRYYPDANRSDASLVYGYTAAQTLEQVLKQCGDSLTRENVMRQAANLKHLKLGGLLPGVEINTSATDYAPIEQLQLERFEGDSWHRFGNVISSEPGG
jgi:branched-chain amino acid transport system substrate-binding protein